MLTYDNVSGVVSMTRLSQYESSPVYLAAKQLLA